MRATPLPHEKGNISLHGLIQWQGDFCSGNLIMGKRRGVRINLFDNLTEFLPECKN